MSSRSASSMALVGPTSSPSLLRDAKEPWLAKEASEAERASASLLQSIVAWRKRSLAKECARPTGTTSLEVQRRPRRITTLAISETLWL